VSSLEDAFVNLQHRFISQAPALLQFLHRINSTNALRPAKEVQTKTIISQLKPEERIFNNLDV